MIRISVRIRVGVRVRARARARARAITNPNPNPKPNPNPNPNPNPLSPVYLLATTYVLSQQFQLRVGAMMSFPHATSTISFYLKIIFCVGHSLNWLPWWKKLDEH